MIRSFTFIVPFVCATFPVWHRLISCSSQVDCEFSALPHFIWQIVWYLIAVLVTSSHVPERFFPGKFDYIGYSHSIMHILVALAAYEQFKAVEVDFNVRRELLAAREVTVTFWNSIVSFSIAAIANVGIALYLGAVIEVEDTCSHGKDD